MGQLIAIILLLLTITGCAASNPHQAHVEQEIHPNIMALQTQAEVAYKKAMLGQAESLYMQVLAMAPDYADGWFRLGNIYTRTGRQEAAINAYMRCIQQAPQHQKAWYNMSLVRIKQATEVLETAQRQGNSNTAVGQQINALEQVLVKLQATPQQQQNRVAE
ncbi:tetratricopeptide repeat protein [Shewanella sp.]|uniref:tetratricopeptide repeat protein n=1 Tax=Shewanella sp. TaxID=50422 RepID=UPI003A97E902